MTAIRGYPSQQKLDRTQIQFVTVEPVHKEQNGASVVSHQFVYEVATDSAESGSTAGKIVATAHVVAEGDIIRLTSGTQSGKEIKVVSVITNEIILAEDLPEAIAAGTTFQILRHKYPLVESTGEVKISGSFTSSEEAVAADGGALPAKVKVAGGYDGSAVQVLKTDANGELQVDVLSSALPTGAATSTNQTNGSQKSQLVDSAGDIADVKLLSDGLLGTDKGLVTNTIIHGETTGGGGGYVDVKVTPSGALTVEATISGIDAAIDGQKTMAASFPVVIASDQSTIPVSGSVTATNPANGNTGSAVPVQATQVAGSDGTNLRALKVDAAGELQVDILSSALPNGAATETTLNAAKVNLDSIAAATNNSNSAPTYTKLLVPGFVNAANTAVFATQGDAFNRAKVGAAITDSAGLNAVSVTANRLLVDGSGVTQPVSNSSLTSLDGKFGSLGQKAMAGSAPVVIASDQSAIPASQSGTWNINNISGTISLPTGAGTSANQSTIITSLQLLDDVVATDGAAALTKGYQIAGTDGTNAQIVSTNASGHVNIADGGNSITVDGSVSATQSGTWNINNISGTVSLPTGAATETTLSGLNTKIPANLTVTSTRLLVDGSGVTQPVSAASLPLPTGAATETTSAAISGKLPATLGQKAMAASLAVTVASDQSAIPVTGSFSQSYLSVVDLLDANILNTATTNIPGSSGSPVQVVASTAAAVKALQCLDTTGAFIGVYTGAAASEVLRFVIGPGSDQTIEHSITSGTRISLRRLDSTTAISSGIVAINFLG